jgi:mRNA-degrading endonuclease toxin of MazEF toxin-antitoxin module
MTTNPTPIRGEVWRIRFDPSEGDEIKKVRMAVVVSQNAVGRLRLKIVVPITEWKPRYASFSLVRTPPADANRCLSGEVGLGNAFPESLG